MWSAVAARELGIITAKECTRRVKRTLRTLLSMEHHEPSGMYYNWYDEATGEAHPQLARHRRQGLPVRLQRRQRLARRRPLGGPQLGAGGVPAGAPAVRPDALGRLLQPERTRDRAGSCTVGSSPSKATTGPDGVYLGTHIGGEDVWLTTHHYDTIVSETRITSYLGIMTGQVPAQHYFAAWRTFPATCDWSLARDAAGRGDPHLPGHRRLRGCLHLPRHAHRPRLGWLDVRGADAQRLRPRGGVGPAARGGGTTRCTSARRSSTAWWRPTTATGASRRRATPSPTTASTASTRWA